VDHGRHQAYTARARGDGIPHGIAAHANRRDDTQPGNNNFSVSHNMPAVRASLPRSGTMTFGNYAPSFPVGRIISRINDPLANNEKTTNAQLVRSVGCDPNCSGLTGPPWFSR